MFETMSRYFILMCAILFLLFSESGCEEWRDKTSDPCEIAVDGLQEEIPNNSTIPTTNNGTEWGYVNVGSSISHTFTIRNNGGTLLNITLPVTITGSGLW